MTVKPRGLCLLSRQLWRNMQKASLTGPQFSFCFFLYGVWPKKASFYKIHKRLHSLWTSCWQRERYTDPECSLQLVFIFLSLCFFIRQAGKTHTPLMWRVFVKIRYSKVKARLRIVLFIASNRGKWLTGFFGIWINRWAWWTSSQRGSLGTEWSLCVGLPLLSWDPISLFIPII